MTPEAARSRKPWCGKCPTLDVAVFHDGVVRSRLPGCEAQTSSIQHKLEAKYAQYAVQVFLVDLVLVGIYRFNH